MSQVKRIIKRAIKNGFDLSTIPNYNPRNFKNKLFQYLVDNKYFVFEEDESLFIGFHPFEDTLRVYFIGTCMKIEPLKESGFFEILIELFRYISIASKEEVLEDSEEETTEKYSEEDSDSGELWL